MQPQGLPIMAELPLPAGVRSRTIPHVNGLCMHVLEAGFDQPYTRGCVLLLHGFRSWRTAGVKSCCPWLRRVITSSYPTSAVMAARPAGRLMSYRPFGKQHDESGA